VRFTHRVLLSLCFYLILKSLALFSLTHVQELWRNRKIAVVNMKAKVSNEKVENEIVSGKTNSNQN